MRRRRFQKRVKNLIQSHSSLPSFLTPLSHGDRGNSHRRVQQGQGGGVERIQRVCMVAVRRTSLRTALATFLRILQKLEYSSWRS